MTALAETPLVDNVFDLFSELYDQEKREDFSLQEYLQACRDDPTLYAGVAERMIAAIGEPELIDTSVDQQLGRIFLNRTIKLYPTFNSPLKKALLTGFHSTAKHNATKAVSPSSETMRTI